MEKENNNQETDAPASEWSDLLDGFNFKMEKNIKRCGNKEKCFIHGECWGHFGAELCQHLGEKDNGYSFCEKDNEPVNTYTDYSEKLV